MAENRFLVAGLGNIGAEYAATRHNIGFMVLDAWARASNVVFAPGRYGDRAVTREKGREIHLLKPSTYMNLSGNAVRYWVRKLEIPAERLLILCDDINLPFGTLRLRGSGSCGGHHGLENIEALLGTQAYPRLRIGIGNDYPEGRRIDYVLGAFSPEETAQIPELAKKAVDGVRTWCFAGLPAAMNQLNARPGRRENRDGP